MAETSQSVPPIESSDDAAQTTRDEPLLERMEMFIEDIGTASDHKLVRYEKDIREGLAQEKKGPFERAHECLGRMLGFEIRQQRNSWRA